MARRKKVRLSDRALRDVVVYVSQGLLGWSDPSNPEHDDAGPDERQPDERLSKLFDDAEAAVVTTVARNTNSALDSFRKAIVNEVGATFANILRVHFSKDELARKTKESDAFAGEQTTKTLVYERETARAAKDVAERRSVELRKEAMDAVEARQNAEKILQRLAVRAGIIPSGALVFDVSPNNTMDLGKKKERELARDLPALAKALDARLVEMLRREKEYFELRAETGDPIIDMSLLYGSRVDEGQG